MRTTAAALAAIVSVTLPVRVIAQTPVATAAPRPELPPRATGAAPGAMPLPPPTDDVQHVVEQWKQFHASTVEQLRFLQQQYRDSGNADAAAVIAAQIRVLQPRGTAVSGVVTPELVNEGLPTRDDPIVMSTFRDRAGQTLSFAIRGRDDQAVFGSKTYADDSGVETAAVHAGLLRAGQSGIVRIKPLPGQDHYEGSTQNGIQSQAAGTNRGSYQFVAVAVVTPRRTSSLASYRDLVGRSLFIPIVGASKGQVWGSDVYTDDSSIAAAAVHAGVLTPGEFGYVKVTLMPGQPRYEGSARGGVTSESFGEYDGSFRIESAPQTSVLELPGGEDASRLVPMDALRTRPGTSFVVQVVGSTSGSVWGAGPYTDDSSIAAAAVHAGLLKAGEAGQIRVTVEPGRESYAASLRNGVRASAYGAYPGSVRLERVK